MGHLCSPNYSPTLTYLNTTAMWVCWTLKHPVMKFRGGMSTVDRPNGNTYYGGVELIEPNQSLAVLHRYV